MPVEAQLLWGGIAIGFVIGFIFGGALALGSLKKGK
jgi:hypothetical protein